jgi:hypothetical protein
VRVELLGSNGPTATGFYVSPLLIVTAAEPFRRTPIVAIYRGGGRSGQAVVVNPGTEGDILLLQPLEQGVFDEPLHLSGTVTQRQFGSDAHVMTVPSTARITLMLPEGPLSVEAKPRLMHDGAEKFDVELVERELPQEFMGSPVIIGDVVAGLVTRLSANIFGASTLRATGAVVVQQVVEQYRDRSPSTSQGGTASA